ncbi:MAG: hypothetical protein U9R39_08655 [Campylobacterota bacterium]|nr:hypothetical protein [Campylobacterota bacterium]
MIIDIIEDENYKDMVEGQIFELCKYLIENDEEFSITANIKVIEFSPEIPESISNSFQQFTMFSLMNYTFTSIELTPTHISFEAGFGAENFGAVVTIPLFAIFQIIIEESILFLNPVATVDKFLDEPENIENKNTQQEARSMNAFTMNKKNKDLL